MACGAGHSAGAGAAENAGGQFGIGANPFASGNLRDTLFRRTFWAQDGGLVAIGGMNVARQVRVCGSPVATAAALHLETAIANSWIHEHHTNAIKPSNRAIGLQDHQPVDGAYQASDLPGLGGRTE